MLHKLIIIWSYRFHGLKYLRSKPLGCKDIGASKSEFVAKTQFIYLVPLLKIKKLGLQK